MSSLSLDLEPRPVSPDTPGAVFSLCIGFSTFLDERRVKVNSFTNTPTKPAISSAEIRPTAKSPPPVTPTSSGPLVLNLSTTSRKQPSCLSPRVETIPTTSPNGDPQTVISYSESHIPHKKRKLLGLEFSTSGSSSGTQLDLRVRKRDENKVSDTQENINISTTRPIPSDDDSERVKRPQTTAVPNFYGQVRHETPTVKPECEILKLLVKQSRSEDLRLESDEFRARTEPTHPPLDMRLRIPGPRQPPEGVIPASTAHQADFDRRAPDELVAARRLGSGEMKHWAPLPFKQVLLMPEDLSQSAARKPTFRAEYTPPDVSASAALMGQRAETKQAPAGTTNPGHSEPKLAPGSPPETVRTAPNVRPGPQLQEKAVPGSNHPSSSTTPKDPASLKRFLQDKSVQKDLKMKLNKLHVADSTSCAGGWISTSLKSRGHSLVAPSATDPCPALGPSGSQTCPVV